MHMETNVVFFSCNRDDRIFYDPIASLIKTGIFKWLNSGFYLSLARATYIY
jgi:hypothetical protein